MRACAIGRAVLAAALAATVLLPAPADAGFDRFLTSALDQVAPVLAVNPADPADWLIAYSDYGLGDGNPSCGFARSHDAGRTFASGLIPRLGSGAGTDPAAIFDGQGNAYVACARGTGQSIASFRFRPGADAPDPPVVVAAAAGAESLGDPAMASFGGVLYLAYFHKAPAGPPAGIFERLTIEIRTSTDQGGTWSAPVQVTGTTAPVGFGAMSIALAIGPEGNVYAGIGTSVFHGSTFSLSRSTDGGKTFSTPTSLGSVFFNPAAPALAVAADGTVYAVYPGADGAGVADGGIRLAKSADRGETWMHGLVTGPGPVRWIYTGAVVTPDGALHVGALGNPDGQRNLFNVFDLRSADGGVTFGPPRRLNNFALDPTIGSASASSPASDGSATPPAAWAVTLARPAPPARGPVSTAGAIDSDIAVSLPNPVPGQVPLVVSALPTTRVTAPGQSVTFLLSVINGGTSDALDVTVRLNSGLPATFHYRETDPATNQPIGSVNPAVDIAPGALRTFVAAITPSGTFAPSDLLLNVSGTNTAPLTTLVGINTVQVASFSSPKPDIVALSATTPNTGILTVPRNGAGAFAVATVNVGASAVITASTHTGAAALPVQVSLCRTDPATGQCFAFVGSSVTIQIDQNETPTFGVFVTASGDVGLDAAANRVYVVFADGSGVSVGGTSVAITTTPTSP